MIDYSVLQEVVVVANPVPSPGDLRVNMMAHVNGARFHAVAGIWEDGYAWHIQHSGGLDSEKLTQITEQLKRGEPAEFHLLCFMDALTQIGFVGVP